MADDETPDHATPLGERLLDKLAGMTLPKARVPRVSGLRAIGLTAPYQVFLLAGLSGLAGAGVLVTLTSGLDDQTSTVVAGLAFVVLILAYRWLQRLLMKSTSRAVESALDAMRTRIATKLIRLDLRDFEARPREELQAKMARHYEVISEATVGILGGLQSMVLLGLTLVYLATLSLVAAAMSVVVLGIAVHAYLVSKDEMQHRMRASADAETALLGSLGEIIDGFKELRLDIHKRTEVLEELRAHSARSARERTITQGLFADLFVFSNTIAFLLGGAVVFLVPLLVGEDTTTDLARVVTVVLFIIGPLTAVVGAAQHFATARFAVTSIKDFETKLDAILTQAAAPKPEPIPAFDSLVIEAAGFSHRAIGGESPFAIGPISLRVGRGEVVFITGGNGSGKTTALRVITGLYPIERGRLLLNGQPVGDTPGDLETYRHLFGTVFADAHVFRRPYALSDPQIEVMRGLLERFHIAAKLPADLRAGYNPAMLSTGQRKRLAMAFALAEGRPVMVFDEWAADQDPEFRAYFYQTLLVDLRRAGKAVIAVTHDDRYFDYADRRYHMEEGHMRLVAGS